MRYRAEVVAELAPAGLGCAVELAVVGRLRKNAGDRLVVMIESIRGNRRYWGERGCVVNSRQRSKRRGSEFTGAGQRWTLAPIVRTGFTTSVTAVVRE